MAGAASCELTRRKKGWRGRGRAAGAAHGAAPFHRSKRIRFCGAAVRDERMARLDSLNRPALAVKETLDEEKAGHAKRSGDHNRQVRRIAPHAQQSHKADHQDWRMHTVHQAAVADGRRLSRRNQPAAASAQQRRQQADQPAQAIRGNSGGWRDRHGVRMRWPGRARAPQKMSLKRRTPRRTARH